VKEIKSEEETENDKEKFILNQITNYKNSPQPKALFENLLKTNKAEIEHSVSTASDLIKAKYNHLK
jgi:hypothetical protein